MDLLMKCASSFQKLTGYEYRFTLGRKGMLNKITLGFSDTDFHHLAGLHKLKDIHVARANRDIVFQRILNGDITYDKLLKSQFLPTIQSRLNALPNLESLLDGNQLIFRYNKKIYPHSSIQSEFLLKMGSETVLGITFLFLDQAEQGIYFCRSFFPMEKTDYTKGQMQYTLLKKEKHNLKTNQHLIQYDHLTFQN
ncbi:MAG: hypothetical protein HDR24_02415 [Lachnospiraceae bacterium]|nr:hypothetical protein [Lachnospiraceae bacterium]